AVLLLPVLLEESVLTPLAVLKLPLVLFSRAEPPLAVLKWPVVFFSSASKPMAVFARPVVSLESAFRPKAVLGREPTFASAFVPPAVFPLASVAVGLQPGAAQTGWPQLAVTFSSTTTPATSVTRRVIEFIEPSTRRTGRRRDIESHA